MDELFLDFKKWIDSKIIIWSDKGIIVDKAEEATHAHQFHVELHSEEGFGRISLYESNKMYWVDFEAGTMQDEFCAHADIKYESYLSIERISNDFIDFMCGYKHKF